jgi:acetyl esterase/lipase
MGMANAAPGTPDDVTVTEHRTTSADGADIVLRSYRKEGSSSRAAALYLHGGGMILGSIDLFDATLARYASASGVLMLAVEYRLAPEHPYPAAVEDSYAGLEWLAGNARELGVDPDRIAVMGDSAGGGLAAGVAIMARDRNGPAIARQILLFPMLDDRTTTTDRHLEPFALWTYDDNTTAWQALLGGDAGAANVPPYAAPARVDDATGLPPTYLEIGQLDIFRDEVLAYARLLGRAGVEVELHLHPGAPHEFETIAPAAAVSRRAVADRIRVLAGL